MARRRSNKSPHEAMAWTQIMVSGQSIEERRDVTERGLRLRLTLIGAGALLLFIVLAMRLLTVQVFSSENYTELANGNRLRETITYAPRGKIFDRNGIVLADNTLRFQLSLTPYLLAEDDEERLQDMRTVAHIAGLDPSEIRAEIAKNGEDYVLPIVAAQNLTHQQALLLEARMPELRGFSVDEVPSRSYRADAALAHVIGYSGRVSEADMAADTSGRLLPTDVIGKAGVELSFDERLRGTNGYVRYEVDALGRPLRVIDQKEPVPGEDIYLSIDLEIQKRMVASMRTQMRESKTARASGVMVSPADGQVLAMVSLPAYDNNLFVGGIGTTDFRRLNSDPLQPLYNDALSGGFTSGSIIKPIVASAALQEGVVTPSTVIVDNGALTLPGGFTFLGWRPEGLGPMNVRSAIAWSSNIYFYTVGGGYGGIAGLGEDRLTHYYRQFGLGEPSGIDLPNETAGRVPDEEWKIEYKGEPWYQGDSYNISIGQGDLLISPLHITMAEAAIANNGYLLKPQIERGAPREVRREVPVDKANLQIVREGMRQVLTNGTTCDCTFEKVPVTVAGKSGTAETDTPGGRRPHAWFTAFAPYATNATRTPEVLATVLIEEGSGGSQYAAPVIADVFNEYYNLKKTVSQP